MVNQTSSSCPLPRQTLPHTSLAANFRHLVLPKISLHQPTSCSSSLSIENRTSPHSAKTVTTCDDHSLSTCRSTSRTYVARITCPNPLARDGCIPLTV